MAVCAAVGVYSPKMVYKLPVAVWVSVRWDVLPSAVFVVPAVLMVAKIRPLYV